MSVSKPILIYLDTSVLGGYFDETFLEETRILFELIARGRVSPVISQMVLGEISRAPDPVQNLLEGLIRSGARVLEITREAVELQEAYLKAGVIGRRWEDDAMHVALASLARVDAITSWNFKHLVDPRRAKGFNAINLTMGYGLIEIRSPGEIVRSVEMES